MKSFKSTNKFLIRGMDVYSVVNDEDFPRDSGRFIGEEVEIDGVIRKVIAVESFAVDPVRKGSQIGLMVAPEVGPEDGTPI